MKLDQYGKFIGPPRIWRKYEQVPGLMMSRSFGDRYGHTCGVISTPEIINFDLSKNSRAVVLGSDGLWEVMTQKQILEVVKKHSATRNADGAALDLLEGSTTNWKIKVIFFLILSRILTIWMILLVLCLTSGRMFWMMRENKVVFISGILIVFFIVFFLL